MTIQMVKDAVKTGFEPAYVLADSWFICDTFVSKTQKIKIRHAKKLHIIGLMKTNRSIIINGIKKAASLVPDYKRKDIRFCKKHKCNFLAIRIEYKGNKLKAFWVKTKVSETWKMLISGDTDITFTNAMKYYQKLNINKCESTDFDAHIAWITLSFISYMMLSLSKRFYDYDTMGEVFRAFKNELLEITLVEKLWQIMELLFQKIFAELSLDWKIFLDKLAEN